MSILIPRGRIVLTDKNNFSIGTAFGFGAATTGGAGGLHVNASSYGQLKEYCESSEALIITIIANLTGPGNEYIFMQANKTVQAVRGVTIGYIDFFTNQKNNLIFFNIKSVHTSNAPHGDVFTIYGSNNVWVHHADLYTGSIDPDEMVNNTDGLIDITYGSDNITVSNCKLSTHVKTSLVGDSEGYDDGTNTGKLHVTYLNNEFYNCFERQPNNYGGTVHVLNNYIHHDAGDLYGYGSTARKLGITRIDNNYFKNVRRALHHQDAESNWGYFVNKDSNTFDNCTIEQTLQETTWTPPYEYASQLISVASVPSIIPTLVGQI